MPLTAASAVFTVVAGLAVGVQVLKHDDAAAPTGPAHPQPATRELSTAETKTLRAQCEAEANRITANGIKYPFRDYKTVRAFEITGVKDPKIVTTWLMGSGEQVYKKGPRNIKPSERAGLLVLQPHRGPPATVRRRQSPRRSRLSASTTTGRPDQLRQATSMTRAVGAAIRRRTTSGIGRSVREPNRPTSG